MARSSEVHPLKSPMVLQLRDGSLVRVAPGPYGKGIAIVPLTPAAPTSTATPVVREPGKRGRKPRPSTLALRERLDADHKAGKLRDPPSYVKWLIDKDDDIGLPMARTIVYRELKPFR